MKKIIFTSLLFCGLAFTAQSQSLQFSQVLLLSSLDTVPQGKVWKVESSVSEIYTNGETYFHVNNNKCIIARGYVNNVGNQGYGTAMGLTNSIFPLWLPAGTIVTSGDLVSALSIIEFNTP